MSQHRQDDLCVLASIFKSEVCKMFADEGKNQAHFLSVNSKTNQTVVAVVAEGDAADLLLKYLDAQPNLTSREIIR